MLTVSYAELIQNLGRQDAFSLICQLGGKRIYVPSHLESESYLKPILGPAYPRLVMHYAGERVELPSRTTCFSHTFKREASLFVLLQFGTMEQAQDYYGISARVLKKTLKDNMDTLKYIKIIGM